VLDGLDTIELLLDAGCLTIHPRCTQLKDAFTNYCKVGVGVGARVGAGAGARVRVGVDSTSVTSMRRARMLFSSERSTPRFRGPERPRDTVQLFGCGRRQR
jgi:hypothetical protein